MTLLIVFLILITNVFPVSAAAGRTVDGTVTNLSGVPIEDASVQVTCLGNVLTTTTDAAGLYSVQFERLSHCLKGSTVTVIAEKDAISATEIQKMGNPSVTIDFVLETAPPASVPEFGTMTGIAAAAGATLFLMHNRKRMQNAA